MNLVLLYVAVGSQPLDNQIHKQSPCNQALGPWLAHKGSQIIRLRRERYKSHVLIKPNKLVRHLSFLKCV